MSGNELKSDSITFGKYKNGTLSQVLRDRPYCKWLLKQEWFKNNYEYLCNRVEEYDPLKYFLLDVKNESGIEFTFEEQYEYFNLCPIDDLQILLSEDDKKCYEYYIQTVDELKDKIYNNIDEGEDNPYNIKAPCRWLKKFEKHYGLKRDVFKDFINSHELSNITTIVERIKKEGGIEYKGAQAFNIAKKRSLEQEAYWENILKEKYGEDLGIQYKFNGCIFDFINISTNTIFEAKLGLKDFHVEQYNKYRTALEKYRIVYLIGYDGVINIQEKVIYTTNVDKYVVYQYGILSSKHTGLFDKEIQEYMIIQVEDLSTLF